MKAIFFLITTGAVLLSGNKNSLNNSIVHNAVKQNKINEKINPIDLKSIFALDSLEEESANLENKNGSGIAATGD